MQFSARSGQVDEEEALEHQRGGAAGARPITAATISARASRPRPAACRSGCCSTRIDTVTNSAGGEPERQAVPDQHDAERQAQADHQRQPARLQLRPALRSSAAAPAPARASPDAQRDQAAEQDHDDPEQAGHQTRGGVGRNALVGQPVHAHRQEQDRAPSAAQARPSRVRPGRGDGPVSAGAARREPTRPARRSARCRPRSVGRGGVRRSRSVTARCRAARPHAGRIVTAPECRRWPAKSWPGRC